jgi:uncharacterized protein
MKSKASGINYDAEELKVEVEVMSDEDFESIFQNVGDTKKKPSVLGDDSLGQVLPLGKVAKLEGVAPIPFKQVKAKRGLDGLGLFAMEKIKKGDKIIEYVGNILLGELEADSKTNMYLFEVNKNKTIDGSPRWNTARYINHSCKGNAESEIVKGRVYVVATKSINEGEEITYDYGEEFFKEYIKPKGCRCGAEKHKYSK